MFEWSEGAITSLVQGSNAGLKGPNYEPYMLVVSMRYVRTGNSMRVHVCVWVSMASLSPFTPGGLWSKNVWEGFCGFTVTYGTVYNESQTDVWPLHCLISHKLFGHCFKWTISIKTEFRVHMIWLVKHVGLTIPGDPATDSALLTTKVRDRERGTVEKNQKRWETKLEGD